MSDDESATRAPELNPSGEPLPAPDASNGSVSDATNGSTTAAGPVANDPVANDGAEPAAGQVANDGAEPAAGQVLTAESAAPPAADAAGPAEDADAAGPAGAPEPSAVAPTGPGAPDAPAPGQALGGAVAFVKNHAVTLVLVVLLIAAVVWGALGVVSTNDWQSRAAALSADLAGAEETLAEARATIDDLEIAKERAETTATACIGAIDDADAMLEVSAKLDDKTVVYLEGLNDFMAAINAGDISAAETIGSEIDALSVQLEELGKQIEGHIDDYEDTAEGCHVDDAQGV
ncbi:hypothetical protein [Promicromonospora sp. MEB111]|uniref:hypothetical protein n=1 Tax=Promicromonospora sp. MEB111 TaxID=3040301 RepID=UPI00254BD472|nr:hypothetical protein [Promicromonospora sp. MEB111]